VILRDELFMGGEWVEPAWSGAIEVIEPATEEVLGYGIRRHRTRTRIRHEWSEVFAGRDVCTTLVLRPSECHRHPHHVARSMFLDVGGVPQAAPAPKLSRTPVMVRHAGRSADVNQVLEQ
jgi:crotonobetainyl-CoA:carnitine CoA-transferase CaiB-like acyl-CoA transferase